MRVSSDAGLFSGPVSPTGEARPVAPLRPGADTPAFSVRDALQDEATPDGRGAKSDASASGANAAEERSPASNATEPGGFSETPDASMLALALAALGVARLEPLAPEGQPSPEESLAGPPGSAPVEAPSPTLPTARGASLQDPEPPLGTSVGEGDPASALPSMPPGVAQEGAPSERGSAAERADTTPGRTSETMGKTELSGKSPEDGAPRTTASSARSRSSVPARAVSMSELPDDMDFDGASEEAVSSVTTPPGAVVEAPLGARSQARQVRPEDLVARAFREELRATEAAIQPSAQPTTLPEEPAPLAFGGSPWERQARAQALAEGLRTNPLLAKDPSHDATSAPAKPSPAFLRASSAARGVDHAALDEQGGPLTPTLNTPTPPRSEATASPPVKQPSPSPTRSPEEREGDALKAHHEPRDPRALRPEAASEGVLSEVHPAAHALQGVEPPRGDKNLTPVSRLAREAHQDPAVRERLQRAVDTAVNQLALQHEARGQLDDPELGRLVVSARSRHGEVDVRVSASSRETRRVLELHAADIVSDARAAELPVRNLTVEERPLTPHATGAGEGLGAAWNGASNRGGDARSERETREASEPSAFEPRREGARRPVRIVL